jgi:hypothetical protein
MLFLSRSVAVSLSTVVGLLSAPLLVHARCRNQPGSSSYPSAAEWSALNDSIDGRLVSVVPSAKACVELGCTEAQWGSTYFRQTIPGSMNAVSLLQESLFGLPSYLSPTVVQLGTGDAYRSMVSIPLIKRQYNDRITALHQSSVYVMAQHVRKEMSLSMRSMPQLSYIFRFASPPGR